VPNTNSTGAKTIIDHRKIDNTKVRKRWRDMSGGLGEASRWIFAMPVKIRVERDGFGFSADKGLWQASK